MCALVAYCGVLLAGNVASVASPTRDTLKSRDWFVNHSANRVGTLGMQLSMSLADVAGGQRTLVDFGATSFVYIALGDGESAELNVGPVLGESGEDDRSQHIWDVLRGKADSLDPFVTAPNASGVEVRPEGWVHLMDREKCLTAFVHQFAARNQETIRVTADGSLEIWR